MSYKMSLIEGLTRHKASNLLSSLRVYIARHWSVLLRTWGKLQFAKPIWQEWRWKKDTRYRWKFKENNLNSQSSISKFQSLHFTWHFVTTCWKLGSVATSPWPEGLFRGCFTRSCLVDGAKQECGVWKVWKLILKFRYGQKWVQRRSWSYIYKIWKTLKNHWRDKDGGAEGLYIWLSAASIMSRCEPEWSHVANWPVPSGLVVDRRWFLLRRVGGYGGNQGQRTETWICWKTVDVKLWCTICYVFVLSSLVKILYHTESYSYIRQILLFSG